MRKLVAFLRTVRFLRRYMPLRDAIRFTRTENVAETFSIRLNGYAHPVTLRGKTTDVECFKKCLIQQEYRSPFDITPQAIIDGGANVGMAALYYANKYPEARILAVEPEEANFRILRRNCCFYSNITLFSGAIWSTETKISLHDPSIGEWAYRVGTAPSKKTVPTFTVSSLMKAVGLNRIDILKLDIEGAEREVFEHSDEWLSKVSLIAIELHDRYEPGCSNAFYSKVSKLPFRQELKGENVFVLLNAASKA